MAKLSVKLIYFATRNQYTSVLDTTATQTFNHQQIIPQKKMAMNRQTTLKIVFYFVFCSLCCSFVLKAQDKGQFSGDLQTSARFYDRDSIRGAYNTPFYEYLKYGADSWLNLNYRISGFDVGLRFDMFLNSQLNNPVLPTNGQALGRWYVKKTIDKFTINAGYLYDQYASGAVYRSYENRALGFDQAIFGLSAAYKITDNWTVKAFTGRLKRQIDPETSTIKHFKPILRGANIDGFIDLKGKLSLAPGVAVVARTMDLDTWKSVLDDMNALNNDTIIYTTEPKFTAAAASFYNTLQIGEFSWYTEAGYKTKDVLRDINGKLFQPDHGLLLFNTVSFAHKGLGVTLQGKYTENFDFRVSPQETFNSGLLNFLPPMARQNTGRLQARYAAASQPISEISAQADITYTPKRGLTFNGNYAWIQNLEGDRLFSEVYLDCEFKPAKKHYKATIGIQAVDFNRFVFQQKEGFVNTLSPFAEFVYKFSKKTSLKTELSYMITKRESRIFGKDDPTPDQKQDLGDWAWVLAEMAIAPHWTFSAGDMYNVGNDVHYPTLFVSYSEKATRFGLTYTKQPEGIVCTGGVCRFEPAFSGVKFDMSTSF